MMGALSNLSVAVVCNQSNTRRCESNRRLPQAVFFDFDRNHYRHAPDLIVAGSPAELKSPLELYTVTRYSKAHLMSYLLQQGNRIKSHIAMRVSKR